MNTHPAMLVKLTDSTVFMKCEVQHEFHRCYFAPHHHWPNFVIYFNKAVFQILQQVLLQPFFHKHLVMLPLSTVWTQKFKIVQLQPLIARSKLTSLNYSVIKKGFFNTTVCYWPWMSARCAWIGNSSGINPECKKLHQLPPPTIYTHFSQEPLARTHIHSLASVVLKLKSF